MDLHDYIDVLRRRWRIIAVCVLLGAAAAVAVTAIMPRVYTATAQLFVATSDDNSSNAYQGGLFTQQRVKSYTQIANSQVVLRPVIDQLHLNTTPEQLAGKISAQAPLDTTLVNINVQDSSAVHAQAIADATAVQLTQYIEGIEKATPDAVPLVKANVVGNSQPPTSPTSPKPALNLAIGLLAGVFVGIGAAVMRDALDTTLRTTDDIGSHLGIATLGTIPGVTRRRRADAGPGAGTTRRTEAFGQLRAHLRFAAQGSMPGSVLVAGALPHEGRTETAIGLATSVAQTGRRVVLVEADLRGPRLARDLGLLGAAGLTDVLTGRIALDEALQSWGDDRVRVLPSGPLPSDPGALLSSRDMGQILRALKAEADFVVVDSPPVLHFADAAVIAPETAGVLLVVRTGKTGRDAARRALHSLRSANAPVLGAVLLDPSAEGCADWQPPVNPAGRHSAAAPEPRHAAERTAVRESAHHE